MATCPFCNGLKSTEERDGGFTYRKCLGCGEEFDQAQTGHDPEGLTREDQVGAP